MPVDSALLHRCLFCVRRGRCRQGRRVTVMPRYINPHSRDTVTPTDTASPDAGNHEKMKAWEAANLVWCGRPMRNTKSEAERWRDGAGHRAAATGPETWLGRRRPIRSALPGAPKCTWCLVVRNGQDGGGTNPTDRTFKGEPKQRCALIRPDKGAEAQWRVGRA